MLLCLQMLQYIQGIYSFYLFHKYTNKFVGDTDGEWPVPVDIDNAVDWKMNSSKDPSAFTIERGNGKVMDIRGLPDGIRLGYYNKHGKFNQQFRFILTPDNYFLLMVDNDKCINWNATIKQFQKKNCRLTDYGKFLIFFETTKKNNDESTTDGLSYENQESIADNIEYDEIQESMDQGPPSHLNYITSKMPRKRINLKSLMPLAEKIKKKVQYIKVIKQPNILEKKHAATAMDDFMKNRIVRRPKRVNVASEYSSPILEDSTMDNSEIDSFLDNHPQKPRSIKAPHLVILKKPETPMIDIQAASQAEYINSTEDGFVNSNELEAPGSISRRHNHRIN